MADTNVQYTQETILNDLRSIGVKLGHIPTRDEYRYLSDVPERAWRRVFGSYGDLLKALDRDESVGDEQESQVFTSDSWNINLPKTRLHTLDEVLEKYKVDLSVWSVERFKIGNYELGMKPPATTEYVQTQDGRKVPMWVRFDKEPMVVPLYRIEASFVRRKEMAAARQEIEDLKNEAKEFARIPTPVVHSDTCSGNMLELLIPDLHAGKFSWHQETGHADYDTKTAIETYLRAVETILDRAKGYEFDQILLGVGNDLLNSDDYNSQTTKGTLVNSDTRYQKTYKAVRQMLVHVIERLRIIAPVVVKVIPGNHDTQSTFTLGDSLECWFHNYDDVWIDNNPSPHKFYRWGTTLLGFTHGDKGKKTDYGLWMATENPVAFGESKFREIHIGHTHGIKVDEKFGVRVRTFAALCPPDAWHSAEHFVGNLRSAEGLVWNLEQGQIAEFIHTEID